MIRFLPLFFSAFFWPSISSAQTDSTSVLHAQCRDADTGASLPYVTVVIRRPDEFPRVYITDLHGRIEIEGLAPGITHVQARRQRYAPSDTTLVLSRGLVSTLELLLLPVPILLREETTVQEHSATDLVRHLIANTRFEYLHTGYANMATYAFDAYSSQKVINRKTEEIVAGIEYTIKGYHQSPDSIAQHITGIRNWGKWRLSVSPGLTQNPARGIVDDKSFGIAPHPLSPDALEHYHYERISTVQVGDLHVSRIGVSPRHGHKPGLIGDLWIARDDFSLVGYDLRLNFPALLQLRGIDHWQVYQQNTRYLNEYWLPERQICTIKTRDYTAQATTRCYRYDLNTDLPPTIFEGPEIVILPEATTRDSSFWAAHAADRDTAHIRMESELLQGDLPAAWEKHGLGGNR